MTHELPPPVQLMGMLFGFAASRAIGVTAELKIADLLKDGAKTSEELAQETGVHARSLYRVLRACASVGVYAEDNEKKFSLTPLAEPLRSDAPGSLRAFAEMIACDWQYQTWAELPYSVKTGKPSFEKVFGMSSFDYFWSNEKAGKVFNDAMTSNSAFSSVAVVNAYDFSPLAKLVDVGGGHGFLLASILAKFSNVKGVLYDTPAIVTEAEKLLKEHDVTDRCETIGGDFFTSVPAGANAYIMKHIIHDWNDEQCITILQNCEKVMAENGKVLVVEMVVPEGNEPSPAKFLDLQMLQFLPGCERTKEEYSVLFDKAGLKLSRIIPTMSPFSIIEGVNKL
ncbi:methyltransferase [Segetibacter aerophilus]|uniref:Methyltransferase n=1 Tax=Segetibacter aerophilus TaxID=670293 RepID=A0A512B8J5_9BACT|nr:methyltransferase [Segetibacter aerophilus]GEO08280.1 methyltransferase [Segetibacter aerophilus]